MTRRSTTLVHLHLLLAASFIGVAACDRVTFVGDATAPDGGADGPRMGEPPPPVHEAVDAAAPPYVVPEALAAPGFELDGVACEVVDASMTPSYYWYGTVRARCPMPYGNVRVLMYGRRDEPYPAFCSEANQVSVFVYGTEDPGDAGAGGDAGDGGSTSTPVAALYRSGDGDPPCAFLSAPDRFDDDVPVVFTGTALALSFAPGPAADTIAFSYRAP